MWDRLPGNVQRQLQEKHIQLWVIDADRVAAESQLGNRINTVMQTCFFALSKVLPTEEAVTRVKVSVEKAYGKRGNTIVERNIAAIDAALAHLAPVVGARGGGPVVPAVEIVPSSAPEFVRHVTARIMAGKGDLLPVSALPADGRFPSGTAKYEKRSIAAEIPIWDPDICIDCGKCAIACPHACIRMKVFVPEALAGPLRGSCPSSSGPRIWPATA